jgi:hypothetical protein
MTRARPLAWSRFRGLTRLKTPKRTPVLDTATLCKIFRGKSPEKPPVRAESEA